MTSALTTAPDPFPPRRDTRLDSVVSYLSAGTNQSSNDFEANATVSGGKDGMRREWNFLLHFQHKAARLSMQMSPQWEIRFIDTEVIEAALRQAEEKPIVVPPSRMSVVDSAAEVSSSSGKRGSETGMAEDTHTEAKVSIPLRCDVFIPFLKYGDMSAFVSESRNTNNNKAGPVEEGKEESSAKAKKAEEDFKTGGIEDKVWLENVEQVEWFYSCIPTEMTLQEYCISCVQFVVKDPQVVSVDGERNLRNLKVGEKMRTWYTIAGHKMFHFYFNSQNKHHLTLDAMFATGTIVNQRGYLFIIRSGDEEDLNNYIQKFFLPYFTKQNRILFDVDVSYRKMISTMLEEQQRHAGELTYQDRDAAVSVSLPLYAMRIRPDYSPVKTVDVGSIACMTFELSVYERLIDDAVVAEITGMPKHKVNKVVLTLDVEDVARMGYPKVMSTEQYSELKTKRILEVYADAKSIGTPTSVPMGRRTGRSRIVSFTYEPFHSVAKGMFSSTLVGNYSVTALYLTSLGGGGFDTHLYTYQQMLSSIVYYQQSTVNKKISRHDIVNIRLTEQDLPRAYANAPEGEREVMNRHLDLIKLSNDGRCDNATEVPVPPDEGGVAPHLPPALNNNERRSMMSASALSDSAIKNLLQNYVSQDKRLSAGSIAGKRLSEPEMDGSTSQMTITVSHIPRLQTGEAEEEEGNESAEAAGTDSEMGSVSPRRSESSEFPFGKRGSAVSFNSGYASPDIPGSRRISLTSVRVPSVVELEEAQRAQEEKAEQERRSLVSRVLNEGEGGLYFGPSLRDVYQRCCEVQGCKPNSYLISKLPTDGRFSSQVEEVDLTASYLGHPGFIAVLRLLDHLPALRRVHFNNMSLDNTDVAAMCDMLASHPTLGEIYLNDNPRITLPSTKHLQRLLAENPRIYVLTLQGTKLGPLVIEKLEREAKEGARQWPQ